MKNNIEKLRKESNITQEELANSLNVTRQTISTKFKNLLLNISIKIPYVENTNIEDFFDEKNKKNF